MKVLHVIRNFKYSRNMTRKSYDFVAQMNLWIFFEPLASWPLWVYLWLGFFIHCTN